MLFPKLFNHGNLRSVKVEEGKVTFEGVYGKETFEGGSGDVHGIPSGGTTGQVLSKSSATDYDAGWSDVNQVPSDGTQNQVLTKGADGYGWSDINAVPSDGTQGQVLTKGASGYGWETPSAGGAGTPLINIRIGANPTYFPVNTAGTHNQQSFNVRIHCADDLMDYCYSSSADYKQLIPCTIQINGGTSHPICYLSGCVTIYRNSSGTSCTVYIIASGSTQISGDSAQISLVASGTVSGDFETEVKFNNQDYLSRIDCTTLVYTAPTP